MEREVWRHGRVAGAQAEGAVTQERPAQATAGGRNAQHAVLKEATAKTGEARRSPKSYRAYAASYSASVSVRPVPSPHQRVLSGIVFVNRNGLRWRDVPSDYNLHKTL